MLHDSNSGTLSGAAQTVTFTDASDVDNIACQVTGTFVGTLTFQGTIDGVNWSTIGMINASSNATETTATAVGIWYSNLTSLVSLVGFRVNCTAYTSGSAVVSLTGGRFGRG